MSEWYYADRAGLQQGPVRTEDLVALLASGQLGSDTLIWRNGMSEWQPMSSFHEEFERVAVAANHDVATPVQADPRPVVVATDPYAAPRANLGENRVSHDGPVVYAGFWRRVAAYMIDGTLMAIVTWAIQIPVLLSLGLGASALGTGDGLGALGAGVLILIYLVPLLLQMAYYGWFHASASQATLGKRAVGIKVTDMEGGRISLGRAIGRYWALLLSGLTMGIGFILAAFTQQKQALHDMVCSTLVVDQHAYTDHPEWQQEGLDTVSKVVLVIGIILFALFFLAMCAAIVGGIAATNH